MATFEERKTLAGEKRIRVVIRRAGVAARRATFDNMRKAREWAAKEETAIIEGRHRHGAAGGHHTAGEMIDRYLEKVLPYKTKKKRYIRQQAQQLKWWKVEIGAYTLANITKPLLIEKRDRLLAEHSPATVNRYLAALSHVFSVAIDDWEWLEQSPITRGIKMKEPRGRMRFLREAERPSFLDACRMEKRKPLFLIAVLVIACGARKEEITAVPLKAVDINRGMIIVEETKNSEPKTFFITGYALELLRGYIEQNRHFKRKYLFSNRTGKRPMLIDREFRRARRLAGLDDFVFHDLRHTHASYMAMEVNADLKTIAESLGQKNLNMANRYTHLTKRHIAEKVREMNDKIFSNPNPKKEPAHA